MGEKSTVLLRGDTVIKTFPNEDRRRWGLEVAAYHLLPFATPPLIDVGDGWLEVEKWTPILDLDWDDSVKYRDSLYEMLLKVHSEGWWHCDATLRNVVVKGDRVALIDWENLTPAWGDVSYDIHGAGVVGAKKPWPMKDVRGVCWSGPWDDCPAIYWGEGD